MAGIVYYTCGHSLWHKEFPQDTDWQSEVECPDCAVVKVMTEEMLNEQE